MGRPGWHFSSGPVGDIALLPRDPAIGVILFVNCDREFLVSLANHTSYRVAGFPGGATWTPRRPPSSMARCTKPDALDSSMNSVM